MICDVCGGKLHPLVTDMPFKVTSKTIVVLKDLPVQQCDTCGNFLIEDAVMARVDILLARRDADAELEVLHYAA